MDEVEPLPEPDPLPEPEPLPEPVEGFAAGVLDEAGVLLGELDEPDDDEPDSDDLVVPRESVR